MEYWKEINNKLKPWIDTDLNKTVVDLFAGCGGLSLGFEANGFKTIGYEMDENASKTYNKNLLGECITGKLTPESTYPKADIVIGGPPCQPFSVGGKQLGLKDSRDGFPIFLSAVRQLNPEVFMFENVRGMLYKNKWYLKEVIDELESLGYHIDYALLNAVNYDVPQNRERVIVIGSKQKIKLPNPVHKKVTAGEALGKLAFEFDENSKFFTESMDRYVANYEKASKCVNPKDLNNGFALKTRDIINYVNEHFNENISSGSYDDIRRKDLKLLTIAEVVLQSSPNSATNDSTRGYSINPTYAELIRNFGKKDWEKSVEDKLKNIEPLSQKLKRERQISKVEVTLPSGGQLTFSAGEHNDLQKAIIEDFLPRYGFGAEVLYVGDTADKYLYLEKEKLEKLNFFEISHEELPDVIAYSKKKNWLYLIEAVHSSGPISEIRLLQLQKLTKNCKADIVYVTAFLNRPKFRQFIADIAWETEVWIADNPDHLVHFNGDKFLGPYKK